MAARRRKTKRRVSRLSSRQRFAAGVGLVVVAAIAAIWWVFATSRNRGQARELHEAAMAMHACYERVYGGAESLADAVDLGFPSAAPLAECREPTLRARDIATRMGASYWVKDHGSLTILREQLEDYASLPFADDAAKLAREEMLEPLTTLDVWQKSVPILACSIASAEGVLDRDCTALLPTPAMVVEPRVISEVTGASPESLSIETARGTDFLVTLSAVSDKPPTWLIHSSDAGATWLSEPLDSRGRAALSGKKAWLVGSDYPKPIRLSGTELAELEALEPVTVGASLVAVERDESALVLASRAAAPGRVAHLAKGKVTATRDAPEGTLIGATTGPPARLFVARVTEKGTEIAQYPIAAPSSEAWQKPMRSLLSAKTLPTFLASGDLACGIAGEKYFPILARDPNTGHATLIAASAKKMFALGFEPAKDAELSLVTGGCPPSVLARSPKGLSLVVPVGRTMGSFPIPPPVAFGSTGAWKTATAACTSAGYAVAFLSKERVIIQTTQPGSWSFTSGRVIARSDENGTPLAVKLLGTEKRLVAVFLRRSEIGELLRAEVLTSDDGGATFR